MLKDKGHNTKARATPLDRAIIDLSGDSKIS